MAKKISLLLTVILLLSGCEAAFTPSASPSPSPSVTPTPAAAQAPFVIPAEPTELAITPKPTANAGGSITLSMRIPKTLNPLLNYDATVDTILKLIFEPLAVLDDKQKPAANSNITGKIEFSKDYSTAEIRLHATAKWSDGTPITSSDIKFTLDTLIDAPESVIYKKCVENVASYEITGSSSITIQYEQPLPSNPYTLLFPIIPKHYYENETDSSSAKNMKPLGNGMYIFYSYTAPKELILIPSSYSPVKTAYISRIKVIASSSYNSDMLLFGQSLTDAVPANLTNTGKYKGSRAVRTAEYLTGYFDLIGFNFDRETFQNLEVRKAIAQLVPFDEILEKVYLNYAVMSTVPVSPQSWLYEPETAYEPETGLDASIKNAAEILSGRRIEILVNEESDERLKIASMLQENLEKAGATVFISSVNYELFKQRLENKQFDIYIAGFNLTPNPDLTFLFHSSENYSGYNNSEMDNLLTNVSNAVSDEDYINAMSSLQKFISKNLPCIGIAFRKNSLITGTNIYGDLKPTAENPYININDWFVN